MMNTGKANRSTQGKNNNALFLLSVLVCAFWIATLFIKDVYRFAVLGALYELLALPMLALLVVLVVLLILQIVKNKGQGTKLPVISLLLVLATVLFLFAFRN